MNRKLPVNKIVLFRPPFFVLNEANWRWDVVVKDHYKLWMTVDGHGWLNCNGADYEVLRGRAHLFAPGDHIIADHYPDKQVHTLSVHFNPDEPTPDLAMNDVHLTNPQLIFDLGKLTVESANRKTPLDSHLCLTLCYTILSLAWSDQFRPSPRSPQERILRLAEEIRTHPGKRFPVTEMATTCGLSVSQFGRTFKSVMGTTPNAFVLQQRINRARYLLAESNLSIGEIAQALGYEDIFYFSTQFKKLTGHSPSIVRKQLDA